MCGIDHEVVTGSKGLNKSIIYEVTMWELNKVVTAAIFY